VNLPAVIAWRYLRRPTDKLISAVGAVSIFGLVIGVMALVISMALMTGYRGDLQAKLLGGNAEIYVYAPRGTFADLDRALDAIRSVDGVKSAAPVLFQQGLVATEGLPTGEQVMVKGIDRSSLTDDATLLKKIVGDSGSLHAAGGEPIAAVGTHLASRIGAKAGDSITITLPADESGSLAPRSATFQIGRIFKTGYFDFDAHWVFLDIHEVRALTGTESANLIEVWTRSAPDLDPVRNAIDEATEKTFSVTDWRSMNRQLFSMLELQQLVLFIVIGLIVFVSTFNIVSTLITTVHEKRKEIGMLTALGATSSMVRRIFIFYGTLVGIAGTVIGIVLGVAVCRVITRYELVSFGPEIAEVYFVSSIPFINRAGDLIAIAAFTSIVSFLATIIPSLRAARLQPAEALRH
jgi:lipoprotein-releasing system permease protein